MRRLHIALIALGVAALGIWLCPSVPSRTAIDPHKLLDRVLSSTERIPYRAKREYTASYYGKTVRKVATVDTATRQTAVISSLIKRNYEPLVEGQDRIAGRETWVLRLKPKLKHRPWKQLWIDKKTFHVLASRDWNYRNEIKRSMKTVSSPHILSSTYILSLSNDADIVEARILRQAQDASGWVQDVPGIRPARLPKYLPPGFVRVGAGSTELHYSDGLNTISIFTSVGKQPSGVRDSGQGLVLTTRRCVVIADLPPAELRKIACSL